MASCELRPDQSGEFAGMIVEAGEDVLEVGDADVFAQNFPEDGAEVRGEREVAAFIELVIVQAGPFAVNLAALYVAAHEEHAVRVAVVRAAIAVFLCLAPDFA